VRAAAKAGMQIGEAETKHFGPLLWSEGHPLSGLRRVD
jgi:hypothetical protein